MGLTPLTLWRCFWRSLFLQAGFSTEGLQSLGLVYALTPALVALYPDAERRQAAFRRHLAPFNTHPYVAAAIVGGILFHELRVARGEQPAESVERFKALLMGPLAALGDGFFWRSLRPAVGALSVALVPLVGPWAVAFFVVAYNLVHLTVRWRLFRLGLAEGEGLVARVKGWRAPTWAARLRVVAAGVAGGVAAWLSIGARGAQPFDLGFALGTVALGLVSLVLLSKRVSPYLLLVGAALLGVLLSVVGAR